MDSLESTRAKIKKLIQTIAPPADEIESQIITDTEHDHYQITQVGWKNKRRVYGCILHLDIKDNKIWIQHNGTEIDIAQELMQMGISKEQIVLGFQSPYKRQYSEFAVA
jgi:XisI protein